MGGALGVLGVGYAGRSQRRMRRVNRSAARLSRGGIGGLRVECVKEVSGRVSFSIWGAGAPWERPPTDYLNSFQQAVLPEGQTRADRDLPSATSIKPTTAFRAAIGTARLAYIMRVTSELLVVARAACELCLKDTCMDERDDCERVGADLQSKPRRSYAHRTSVFSPSNRPGRMVL